MKNNLQIPRADAGFQKLPLLSQLKINLKFAGNALPDWVNIIRNRIDSADLFIYFSQLFPTQEKLEKVYGKYFPERFSQIAINKPDLGSGNIDNEIIWAICRSIQNAEKLSYFINCKNIFERAIIIGDKTAAELVLSEVESTFGQSCWLLQSELQNAHRWGGIQEARTIFAKYLSDFEGQQFGLAAVFLIFIDKRTQSTSTREYLKSELSKLFKDRSHQKLENFLNSKFFGCQNLNPDFALNLLKFESCCSGIDYYEALIAVLQAYATEDMSSSLNISTLEKPIRSLHAKIGDVRLVGILRGLGISSETEIEYSADRAEIIESYTAGKITDCFKLCSKYMAKNPIDCGILAIYARCGVAISKKLENTIGLMTEVADYLFEVHSASSRAYASASGLLTLADKYYGQSWINYFRALIAQEMGHDTDMASSWLRAIYTRDVSTTPFSAFSATGTAKLSLECDELLQSTFPLTSALYNIAKNGLSSANDEFIDPIRKIKYLAKFYLANESWFEAENLYRELYKASIGAEKIKAAGGAAFAMVKLSKLQDALSFVVDAYLYNSNLPTALSIKEIYQGIDNIEKYADNISLPIILDLYVTYFNNEGLTKLRYAFERFQSIHDIETPEDITSNLANFGFEKVILYLEKIWRIEVMRQTLLYSSMKEIEEARIKVCQLLVELNPSRSDRYLNEVRELVKQQEISKGTTLIEQTKVYVDIDAIKKYSVRK